MHYRKLLFFCKVHLAAKLGNKKLGAVICLVLQVAYEKSYHTKMMLGITYI